MKVFVMVLLDFFLISMISTLPMILSSPQCYCEQLTVTKFPICSQKNPKNKKQCLPDDGFIITVDLSCSLGFEEFGAIRSNLLINVINSLQSSETQQILPRNMSFHLMVSGFWFSLSTKKYSGYSPWTKNAFIHSLGEFIYIH